MDTTYNTNKINQSSSLSSTDEQSQERMILPLEASDLEKKPATESPLEVPDSDNEQRVSTSEKQRVEKEHEEQDQEHLQTQEVKKVDDDDDNGRERLKRYRKQVAGRVWIPEMWGQEELLKDWIDCSAFDSCLVPTGISSARAALVEEARRASSNGGVRVENRCLFLR